MKPYRTLLLGTNQCALFQSLPQPSLWVVQRDIPLPQGLLLKDIFSSFYSDPQFRFFTDHLALLRLTPQVALRERPKNVHGESCLEKLYGG